MSISAFLTGGSLVAIDMFFPQISQMQLFGLNTGVTVALSVLAADAINAVISPGIKIKEWTDVIDFPDMLFSGATAIVIENFNTIAGLENSFTNRQVYLFFLGAGSEYIGNYLAYGLGWAKYIPGYGPGESK